MRSNLKQENAAVLVELLLVLPLVLMFAVGIVNFGALLWQQQVMSQAVRHGARMAATRSNLGMPCSQVMAEATSNAQTYVNSYIGQADNTLGAHWENPSACFERRIWDAGYEEWYIFVQTQNTADPNCTLCMTSFMSFIPVSARGSFALEHECDGAKAPAC